MDVLDEGGGLGADAGEDLQVLLGEGARGELRVEVHDAEEVLGVQQGHGHAGADALHDDRLGGLEAGVHHRVGGQDGRALRRHHVEHGLGEVDRVVGLAPPGAHRPGVEVALVVVEQHRAAVGGEELEGQPQDGLQQPVEVELETDLFLQFVDDAQLLVVPAEGVVVLDLGRRKEAIRGLRGDLVADVALGDGRARRGDGNLGALGPALPLVVEDEPRVAHRHVVAVAQRVLVHAHPVDERAVQALQVLEQVLAALQGDRGVVLGHDAVQELQRIVGVAADRGERPQLDVAGPFRGVDGELRHARRRRSPPHAAERDPTRAGQRV